LVYSHYKWYSTSSFFRLSKSIYLLRQAIVCPTTYDSMKLRLHADDPVVALPRHAHALAMSTTVGTFARKQGSDIGREPVASQACALKGQWPT
jgi:hypothetical protein